MSNEKIKHVFVSSTDQPNMPIVNGQIICLNNERGLFYDVNGHRYHVNGNSDTANSTITFTSNDALNPSQLATMPGVLASGETHASLLGKISTVVKNIRFIISLLGSTDISTIGDGTVSGAISTLNTSKQNVLTNPLTQSDVVNNLTSTSAVLPLAAAQGKVLNEKIGFKGTQAEFNAAVQAGTITDGMTVIITDDISTSVTNVPTIVGPVESSTASKAYSVGQYLVYNDTLYQVTSAISAGGSITPGTNVTARTITDVLTTLSVTQQYPS